MCLNVGGAVLGVALSTLVVDAVSSQPSGNDARSQLDGYRAGYYLCLGFCGLAMVLSLIMIYISQQQVNKSEPDHSETELRAMEKGEGKHPAQSNTVDSVNGT